MGRMSREERDRQDDSEWVEVINLYTTREHPFQLDPGEGPQLPVYFVEEWVTPTNEPNARHVWAVFNGDELLGKLIHYYPRRWAYSTRLGAVRGVYDWPLIVVGLLLKEVCGGE